MRVVQSSMLKDFAVKPQSKRIIYFNDTLQVFMSTFLDGSASHLVLPQVPFMDVKSFACENNDFLVTDGKAVFQQDSLSFNEFIVGCDLSHIKEFGFDNLVIFGSYTQPHPLPSRPQQLSVLFGSHQALVQWKAPALAIGASECPVPSLEIGLAGRRGKLDPLDIVTQCSFLTCLSSSLPPSLLSFLLFFFFLGTLPSCGISQARGRTLTTAVSRPDPQPAATKKSLQLSFESPHVTT